MPQDTSNPLGGAQSTITFYLSTVTEMLDMLLFLVANPKGSSLHFFQSYDDKCAFKFHVNTLKTIITPNNCQSVWALPGQFNFYKVMMTFIPLEPGYQYLRKLLCPIPWCQFPMFWCCHNWYALAKLHTITWKITL